tara:strand:+ start:3459 stop:3746 length:288 start_codon:yes stop_codon:yes gene_type:complete
MSIIFVPKIPKEFAGASSLLRKRKISVEKNPCKEWLEDEVNKVVNLRSLGVSFLEISRLLGRRQSSVAACVSHKDLYDIILQKKKAHIAKVMYDT